MEIQKKINGVLLCGIVMIIVCMSMIIISIYQFESLDGQKTQLAMFFFSVVMLSVVGFSCGVSIIAQDRTKEQIENQ